jgi:hypothetical protein
LIANQTIYQEEEEMRQTAELQAEFAKIQNPKDHQIQKYLVHLQNVNNYAVDDIKNSFAFHKNAIAKAAAPNINALKVVQNLESSAAKNSITSIVKRRNINRVKSGQHGLVNVKDLCHLQIQGVNQL